MIGVIDYGMGNVQSVLNAFEYLGASTRVVKTPEELLSSEKIVLPGVGAFGVGMENLKKLGLIEALSEEVMERKKPFLGICLGMQLICKESFEFGHHPGLGWIDASVCKLDETLGLRVPHVGWNDLLIKRPNRLLDRIEGDLDVYFVHSFYVKAKDPDIVAATCEYGREFACMLEKDNIFAVQFHPEKSQSIGLGILEKFNEVGCNA